MFSDPQSVTINSVAKSMPRVSTNGQQSVYTNSDESYKLTISHQISGDKVRSLVRLDNRAIVADPLTSVNDYQTHTTYVVDERPKYGFTMTQVEQQFAGFLAWFTTGNVDKIFGGES